LLMLKVAIFRVRLPASRGEYRSSGEPRREQTVLD
jgi:hypothetical protein